ncbi:MAG: hypothetical protein CMJ78_19680 [Planctomycetaceae bacterium]|nr:hypothetical protein [Planctomycetaceae bacterium]
MQRRSTPSKSPAIRLLMAVGIVASGGLLTYGGLDYFGLLNASQTAPRNSRAGMVKVPRSQRALTALAKVTREDVHNLQLGDESYFWMSAERVAAHPEWITNPADIVGRVMARNKSEQLVFTEKDFLPEGSRTGLSGGVPEGKQGFFLDASKIPGLDLLKMGDRFDLLASLPDEAQKQQQGEYGLLAGGIKVRGGKPIPLSGVRLLVQNAEMIAVTRGRQMTTQGVTELPETARSGSTQITIAIDPGEVVPLTQALAADRAIHCVARSGQNDADATSNSSIQLSGMIAFPATSRPIKAFSRITADDLADSDTGELRTYYFPKENVRDEWIMTVNDLIGRVVARDVSAGFIFSKDDFLPESAVIRDVKAFARIVADDLVDARQAKEYVGRVAARDFNAGFIFSENDLLPKSAVIRDVKAFSRIVADDLVDARQAKEYIGRVAARDLAQGAPLKDTDLLPPDAAAGIAGGTPTDRVAISIDLETVHGVGDLNRGDQFDLLASRLVKPGEELAKLGTDVKVSGSPIASSKLMDQARNTVLAREALVVDIGEKTATIAVLPSDVPGITKAITLKASIFALLRSGQPGSESHALESDPDTAGNVTIVEEIVGGKRTVRVFAGSKKSK